MPKNTGGFSCCMAIEVKSESTAETSQEEGKVGRRNMAETGRLSAAGSGRRESGRRRRLEFPSRDGGRKRDRPVKTFFFSLLVYVYS